MSVCMICMNSIGALVLICVDVNADLCEFGSVFMEHVCVSVNVCVNNYESASVQVSDYVCE